MKRNIIILLTIMLLIPHVIKAAELKLDWQIIREVGEANLLFPVGDSEIIQLTYSESQENIDYYDMNTKVIKYDKTGNKKWEKTWGGNNLEELEYVLETNDNGFLVIGHTFSTDIDNLENKGESDIVLIKYDQNGNLLNQNIWGGNGEEYFMYDEIIQTSDNSFIMLVSTTSDYIDDIGNIPSDSVIIKFDKDGSIIWVKKCNSYTKLYKGINDDFFVLTNIIDDESRTNDFEIVRYDKTGNIIWKNKWGGNNEDIITSIELLKDNSIVMIGQTNSTDIEGIVTQEEMSPVVIKYDESGNLLWQKSYNTGVYFEFLKVIPTNNGEFIIIGTGEYDDTNDIVIVKYDKNGNVIFENRIQGNDLEEITNVLSINDNNFLISVLSFSESLDGMSLSGNGDNLIIKIDYDGKIISKKIIETIQGITFKTFKDEGFVIFGQKNDALISKYDKEGNMMWEKEWGGSGMDFFSNSIILNDGSIVANAVTTSFDIDGIENTGGMIDVLVKFSTIYDINEVTNEENNGTQIIEQQGNLGVINAQPNKGYEVDEIVIKDNEGNVLDVEVTEQEDGTFTFPLFTDVSVEVIYALAIDNPKTGILDVMTILIIGFIMSVTGIFIVKNYNERLEF